MLDLIRKGWRRVVWFIFGRKVSPEGDVVKSTGQEILVDTRSLSSVPTVDDTAPDKESMEIAGTHIPDTPCTSPVSPREEVVPDQNIVESTRTAHPVDTSPASSVSTADEAAPKHGVMENKGTGIPVESLAPSSTPTDRITPSYDFSRWTVTEVRESPFEKCGRLYIEGDDLVIRTDLDTRGFRTPLRDIVAVLNGEPQPIRVLMKGNTVGIAKRSTSGKAMNFIIDPYLYTVPMSRVMDVLEGRARKAAVFVGRDG